MPKDTACLKFKAQREPKSLRTEYQKGAGLEIESSDTQRTSEYQSGFEPNVALNNT